MKIITRFTQLLNVSTPIISAPVGPTCARSDLAVAVTAGGGFGQLGVAFADTLTLVNALQDSRRRLDIPTSQQVPVGIGFIGWILDNTEISTDPRLPRVLAESPKVIWLAFGVDLGKYVRQIRAYDAKRAHKTKVFVIVNSVEDALRATNVWKVDGLVIQGIEAGGHGGSESPPLFILLQAVIKAIPGGPLKIAAGGISTGPQIAALLTMGADAVALGTRFLTTNECGYPPAHKLILQQSDYNDTIRTLAFDDAQNTNFWPPKIDARAIKNKIIDDFNEGLSLEERQRRFNESRVAGSTDRLVVNAGMGVGLSHDIRNATDLVRELHRDIVTALSGASSIIRS